MNILELVGRSEVLFSADMHDNHYLNTEISAKKFLIIGGAGTIGQAVTKNFARNPNVLHVVDISENNLAELVRDVRSTLGYISGDFRTFQLIVGD